MSKDDLIFIYQGAVNDTIVNDILQLAENALYAENIKNKIKRRIFRVILEGIQNLYKHNNVHLKGPEELKEVTTALAREENGYVLILGNYIDVKEKEVLKERIDLINSQDHEELRKMYIETLNDNERTKDGGSGLGLMDMARKTKEPLTYEFSKVDEQIAYFKLKVKIRKDG